MDTVEASDRHQKLPIPSKAVQLLLGDADAEEERELQQALWLSSQQQQPYDMDAQGLQQDDRPDQGLLCLVHYYHADNQSHGQCICVALWSFQFEAQQVLVQRKILLTVDKGTFRVNSLAETGV